MLGELVKVTVGTGLDDPEAVMHGPAGTRVLVTTNAECTSGDDGPVATGTWQLEHRGCRDGAGFLPRMSGT